MAVSRYRSWGFSTSTAQRANRPSWRTDISQGIDAEAGTSLLPFGNGRSYGDSCLNSGGVLLDAASLDRFIAFDDVSGLLTAEAGVTLADILRLVVPHGWFLPVSPGTSYVTLGGAVANDVHGKNHHCDGTIGQYIHSFELVRSNGDVLTCSESDNVDLFAATIGGLGLTGFITKVCIQLISINSSEMDVRVDAFQGLQAFAELSAERKNDYQYTVAWLDCAASGAQFARGIFLSANHAPSGSLHSSSHVSKLSIPVPLPTWLLNTYSIRAFNKLYYYKQSQQHEKVFRQDYQPYFYPLDAIANWNRIYGARGFYQYQFVIPLDNLPVLESLLRDIVDSGMGSFLAVLKEFGDIESPGMLSFPRQGFCLALDFANRGVKTEQLIQRLDQQVMECGGAAYPAKDRLMSAKAFEQYFPKMGEFTSLIDPNFSSDFWERVSG